MVVAAALSHIHCSLLGQCLELLCGRCRCTVTYSLQSPGPVSRVTLWSLPLHCHIFTAVSRASVKSYSVVVAAALSHIHCSLLGQCLELLCGRCCCTVTYSLQSPGPVSRVTLWSLPLHCHIFTAVSWASV